MLKCNLGIKLLLCSLQFGEDNASKHSKVILCQNCTSKKKEPEHSKENTRYKLSGCCVNVLDVHVALWIPTCKNHVNLLCHIEIIHICPRNYCSVILGHHQLFATHMLHNHDLENNFVKLWQSKETDGFTYYHDVSGTDFKGNVPLY